MSSPRFLFGSSSLRFSKSFFSVWSAHRSAISLASALSQRTLLPSLRCPAGPARLEPPAASLQHLVVRRAEPLLRRTVPLRRRAAVPAVLRQARRPARRSARASRPVRGEPDKWGTSWVAARGSLRPPYNAEVTSARQAYTRHDRTCLPSFNEWKKYFTAEPPTCTTPLTLRHKSGLTQASPLYLSSNCSQPCTTYFETVLSTLLRSYTLQSSTRTQPTCPSGGSSRLPRGEMRAATC